MGVSRAPVPNSGTTWTHPAGSTLIVKTWSNSLDEPLEKSSQLYPVTVRITAGLHVRRCESALHEKPQVDCLGRQVGLVLEWWSGTLPPISPSTWSAKLLGSSCLAERWKGPSWFGAWGLPAKAAPFPSVLPQTPFQAATSPLPRTLRTAKGDLETFITAMLLHYEAQGHKHQHTCKSPEPFSLECSTASGAHFCRLLA